SGRGGDGRSPPGDRRLPSRRERTVRSILLHRACGRRCPPGLHRRWPPGAGRGSRPGGAARGTLVGSRNLSPPGRLAPAADGDTAGGGGNLVAAGSGRRPSPGGEVTGAAGRHEPSTPVAAAG